MILQTIRWYHALAKPAWTPPDPAIGAVWTCIFALAALSAVLAWRGTQDRAVRLRLVGLFAANGLLNGFWAVLFFGLRRPDWALVETAALWLSIVALMVFTWPPSRRASLLLAPYLLWVSLASLLNYDIVRLNGPFH